MDILRLNLNQAGPDAPTEGEVRFQVALLAAIAGTAAALLARFAFGAPLVPELLAHTIFALSPIKLVEVAVGMLGSFAKHAAFLGCVVVYAAALVGAGTYFLKRYAKLKDKKRRWLALGGLAAGAWFVTMAAIIPLLGGGFFGEYLRPGALASSTALLIVYVVYAMALGLTARWYLLRPETAQTNSYRLSRRRVLRGVGFAVIALAAYDIGRSVIESWFEGRSGRVRGGNGIFPNIDGLAREVTPTEDFYKVSKNPFDPLVDAGSWRLEVVGMVESPLRLTLEEIRAMPAVEQYATLECIDNTVGGNLMGNALWRGVRLRDLLERAGLQAGVIDIVLRASDDYDDSIPVERALAEGTMLAYEMNGAPLTPAHGYPLRLIVPGIYGMKNVKWVTRLEAVNKDYKGYWQWRGWDDRAEYKTMSRLDVPYNHAEGTTTIAGVAFAGDRGISKVEVSTDGGATWQEAEIKPALSPYAWVLWHREWTPPAPGKYQLVVRATDGKGETQTPQYAPPAPEGATGYHRRTIQSGEWGVGSGE